MGASVRESGRAAIKVVGLPAREFSLFCFNDLRSLFTDS